MPLSWHQQKDDNAQKGTQRCTRQSNTVKHSLNIFFVYVLKRPVLALLKTTLMFLYVLFKYGVPVVQPLRRPAFRLF
jgi:sugar phosphate permease